MLFTNLIKNKSAEKSQRKYSVSKDHKDANRNRKMNDLRVI